MRMGDLIVCEKRDRLTLTLRIALQQRGVDPADLFGRRSWLRQRSGIAAVPRLLDEAPASMLVLETTAENLAAALHLLSELPNFWPAARAVVAVDEQTSRYRTTLREAGAIHIVQTLVDLDAVAEMTLKHFERMKPADRTWRDEIWEMLPWG